MVGGLGWYIAKKISSVQARLIKKKKKSVHKKSFTSSCIFSLLASCEVKGKFSSRYAIILSGDILGSTCWCRLWRYIILLLK